MINYIYHNYPLVNDVQIARFHTVNQSHAFIILQNSSMLGEGQMQASNYTTMAGSESPDSLLQRMLGYHFYSTANNDTYSMQYHLHSRPSRQVGGA